MIFPCINNNTDIIQALGKQYMMMEQQQYQQQQDNRDEPTIAPKKTKTQAEVQTIDLSTFRQLFGGSLQEIFEYLWQSRPEMLPMFARSARQQIQDLQLTLTQPRHYPFFRKHVYPSLRPPTVEQLLLFPQSHAALTPPPQRPLAPVEQALRLHPYPRQHLHHLIDTLLLDPSSSQADALWTVVQGLPELRCVPVGCCATVGIYYGHLYRILVDHLEQSRGKGEGKGEGAVYERMVSVMVAGCGVAGVREHLIARLLRAEEALEAGVYWRVAAVLWLERARLPREMAPLLQYLCRYTDIADRLDFSLVPEHKLIENLHLLSPQQLCTLSSVLTPSQSLDYSHSPNSTYLAHLHNHDPSLVQQYLEYCRSQLVLNSYPSAATLHSCYLALTNILHLQPQLQPELQSQLEVLVVELIRYLCTIQVGWGWQYSRLQVLGTYIQRKGTAGGRMEEAIRAGVAKVEQEGQLGGCLMLANSAGLWVGDLLGSLRVLGSEMVALEIVAQLTMRINIDEVDSSLPHLRKPMLELLHSSPCLPQSITQSPPFIALTLHLLPLEDIQKYLLDTIEIYSWQQQHYAYAQSQQGCTPGYSLAQLCTYLSLHVHPAVLGKPKFQSSLLQQMLSTRFATVSKIATILPMPMHTARSQKLDIDGIVGLLAPDRLYNLYQAGQTGLRFNEVTDHNPHRQLVLHSDFYRNNINQYLLMEAIKLHLSTVLQQGREGQQGEQAARLNKQIAVTIIRLLQEIKQKQATTGHHSLGFHTIVQYLRFIHVCIYYPTVLAALAGIDTTNTDNIMCILVQIMQRGYMHQLVRQYITVIFAKVYQHLQTRTDRGSRWWQCIQDRLNSTDININTHVPLLLTIGQHLLAHMGATQQLWEQQQCPAILRILVKYISCHHAYVRTIAQYYVMRAYLGNKPRVLGSHVADGDGHFLEYLCENTWVNDRDCVKILKNIRVTVEGFRECMEAPQALDFLGYQRVEEYPDEVVFRQLRGDLLMLLECTLKGGSMEDDQHRKIEHKIDSLRQQLLKSRGIPQLVLHVKQPKIVIIASLLEKVHNFGQILKTLHSLEATLVVPSRHPLQHPECQCFIPPNSQVETIEVKEAQLEQYIRYRKSQGYQMVALEQCSGSVKVEECTFPDRYMLLLGNERLGAPASLLGLADLLVEIPQVGKVRSLNVHVSMVVCLWEAINRVGKV